MRRRWLLHLLPWIVALLLVRAATSLRGAAPVEASAPRVDERSPAGPGDPLEDALHPPHVHERDEDAPRACERAPWS